MNIEPQSPLALVYKLEIPDLFANTYYVRATIRDSYTGTTLNTVNLTRSSDGSRYTNQTQAPSDTSGLGRMIDITTSVYSDSDYSVRASEGFAEQIERFMVRSQSMSFGGGGADTTESVDYEKIKKLIEDVIKDKVKIPVVKIPKTDLSEVVALLNEIKKIASQEIKFPEQIKTDLSPILTAVKKIEQTLSQKISDIPETNLTPVLSEIKDSASQLLNDLSKREQDQEDSATSLLARTVDSILSGTVLTGLKELQESRKKESEMAKPLPRTELVSKYFQQK